MLRPPLFLFRYSRSSVGAKCMTDRRATDALREATKARERAIVCGDSRMKQEWLKVAFKWDEIAQEYRRLEELETKRPKQA